MAVVSYDTGPRARSPGAGLHIAALLRIDQNGNFTGGGAIGDIILLDGSPVQVAWTYLLGPQPQYAFFGVIHTPGVAAIELTEQDGSVHHLPVAGQGAFFLVRPDRGRPGTGWSAQAPARIRAFDSRLHLLYERSWPQDR